MNKENEKHIKNEKLKEEIKNFCDLFVKDGKRRGHYIDENNFDDIKDSIRNIIKTELEDEDGIFDKLSIKYIFKSDETSYSYKRELDENGKLKEKQRNFNIDLDILSSTLAYGDEKKILRVCEKFTKVIFHEIQHLRQDIAIDNNISSNRLLTYTRDNVLFEEMPKKVYNHTTYGIECDAEENGCKRFIEIMGEDPEMEKEILKNQYYYAVGKYDVDGKKAYRDDRADELMDELICNQKRSDLLVKFPPLLKIYNKDCTKKSVEQLLQDFNEEKKEILDNKNISQEEKDQLIKDGKEMRFELVYNRLKDTDQSEISKCINKNLIKEMTDYFKEVKKNKIEIVEKASKILSPNRDYEGDIKELETYYDNKCKFLEELCKEEDFRSNLKTSNPSNVAKQTIEPEQKEETSYER